MKLIVDFGSGKKLEFECQKSSAIVGRIQSSDIIIPHDSISRTHCRIDVKKGIFFITDLGSSNGTFIDDLRLGPQENVPFPISSKLVLGKLSCSLSESTSIPYVKSSKDFKSAIKKHTEVVEEDRETRRIEIAEARGLVESPKYEGRMRNPVSTSRVSDYRDPTPYKSSKKFYVYMFIIVALIEAYLINLGIK